MKLKSAVLYRYEKHLRIIGIFAALLLIPIIGALIATKMNRYPVFTEDSPYLSMICCAMSFVFGVFSYRPVLKFFLQNGVSRQSTHLSFILALPVGFILAVFESAVHFLVVSLSNYFAFGAFPTDKTYGDFFSIVFGYQGGIPRMLVLRLVIETVLFIALMSFGYMLSSVFSGMKPFYKLIVIIVVVVAIVFSFAVSSVTDSYAYLGMPTWLAFLSFFIYGNLGISNADHFIAAMIILSILFVSVSHLIIRKAAIRK